MKINLQLYQCKLEFFGGGIMQIIHSNDMSFVLLSAGLETPS